MKETGQAHRTTTAKRKARIADVVARAKAAGEEVPSGVTSIAVRDLTNAELAYGKTLEPLARVRASRRKAAA
ncbi:MAG: hypothetical protein ABI883_02845 [Chthoniobacterales bacterium]